MSKSQIGERKECLGFHKVIPTINQTWRDMNVHDETRLQDDGVLNERKKDYYRQM